MHPFSNDCLVSEMTIKVKFSGVHVHLMEVSIELE